MSQQTGSAEPQGKKEAAPLALTSNKWLERGMFAALLLACAIALSPNQVDPDLWGHVQYAEDSLAQGKLDHEATHTFTAVGQRWINHENLAELSLALGHRWWGAQGILVAKCLLGLFVMGLMMLAARRRGVSMPVLCGTLLMVATALTAFWAARPQIGSFVLLAILLTALDRAFADWSSTHRIRAAWLWIAPPLMAVWANTHGGFAAGWCILAAYLGCRSLEALYHRGRASWPMIGRLALILTASLLATLLTPYGADLHVWLSGTLHHTPPEISEWGPPLPSDVFFFPFILLLSVSIAALCLTEKRRDWTQIVILLLIAAQAIAHSRHIALLALLVGCWLPEHVQSMVTRLRRGAKSGEAELASNSPLRYFFAAGIGLTLVLLCARLSSRLCDFPVEKDEYPVAALQYMVDHDLHGRLVVSFNWAQYALAALAPETTVAFDGRFNTCYPQEIIDMHFDFLVGDLPGQRYRSEKSGPIDPQKVLHFQEPNLLLVDRRYARPKRVLAEQQDFVLLYQDALAQVWGRRSEYDNPRSLSYLAPSARQISDAPQSGSVTWPAFPIRPESASELAGQRPAARPFSTISTAAEDPRS